VSFLGVFCSTMWKTRHQNPPFGLGGGGGGTLCMWLGLAHFHKGYSFLMISPNLLDIWPMFLLILSHYETAHFFIVLRPPGNGYSLVGSKK